MEPYYFALVSFSFLTCYSYAVDVCGTSCGVSIMSVRHGCIVAKRCDIGPWLLLITNRKLHNGLKMT